MSSPSAPAAPLLALTRFQVLSRQHRFQQTTRARLRLCQPWARVFKERAAGFVAGEITLGFTVHYAHPPG